LKKVEWRLCVEKAKAVQSVCVGFDCCGAKTFGDVLLLSEKSLQNVNHDYVDVD
jgi:hypothetical protein